MQLRSRGRFEVNTVFPLFSDHRIIKVVSDVECLCSLQLIIRQQCVVDIGCFETRVQEFRLIGAQEDDLKSEIA